MMVGGLCMLLSVSAKAQQIDQSVVEAILKSFPSHLEVTFLLKDLGTPYNAKLFNPASRAKNYSTKYQQALNLGIYSTSLGFTMLYEQPDDTPPYLAAIQHLARDLQVAQVFDRERIEYFLNEKNKFDSLLLETNTNLEKINSELFKTNRADLSTLMLLGGWLESLYLASRAYIKSPQDFLKGRIEEQKIILEQFLLLLSFYENQEVKQLTQSFNRLQQLYTKSEVIKNETDSITTGSLVMVNGPDQANFTPQDIAQILQITTQIRTKIIQGK